MDNARFTYIKLFQDILLKNKSLTAIKQEVEEKDRNFVNMLFLTALRELTFIKSDVLALFVKKNISKKQDILNYIFYLSITELLFMDTPDYAVINTYVEIAKKQTGKFGANFVNAVLRNVIRNKEDLLKNKKGKYFSNDFLKILKQDYSLPEIQEMETFVPLEPPLDITLKNSNFADKLDGTLLPTGSIRLPSNTKVSELIGYKEGEWWVQDASSALAVNTLKSFDLSGKNVLDLCAAPGGKTAQLLNMGAHVTAVDISSERLSILKENMERLKLTKNLTIICEDALMFSSQKLFDFILVDAPCSATGTFRRHPEILHTKTLDDVEEMAILQKDILDHAIQFLTPQGILIYAVCSLAKKEGEQQIYNFINRYPDFQILPISIPQIEDMITDDGFLRILPQNLKKFSGSDGFFVACLKRKI